MKGILCIFNILKRQSQAEGILLKSMFYAGLQWFQYFGGPIRYASLIKIFSGLIKHIAPANLYLLVWFPV
jgi:hypothetical protein